MHATVGKVEVLLRKLPEAFSKQNVVVMETCNCHGNDIIGIHTKFISKRATIGEFEE